MPQQVAEYIIVEDLPELCNTYLREITAFIYNIVRDEEETMELVHDIFYSLCMEINNTKITGKNIRSCLYKISHDLSLELIKKKEVNPLPIENNIHHDTKNNPEENQLIDSIVMEDVYMYIDKKYSDMEKMAFNLKYFHNLHVEEIAEVINSSAQTVSKIIKNMTKEINDEFHDTL